MAAVEAALFLADEPLTTRKIATVAGLADANEAREILGKLRAAYEVESAVQVEELAGGWQLLTKAELHPWLARFRQNAVPTAQLSAAARETLTIVAYRQPVTRADVEAIRGVGCSEVLKQLIERGLVRLAGRDDSLGRPALYETTKKFLQMFGLKSIKELPATPGSAGSSS